VADSRRIHQCLGLTFSINLTIQITSNSAQVTAGPHHPWCNTEYIFVANVPHKTFYENFENSSSKHKTSTDLKLHSKLHF